MHRRTTAGNRVGLSLTAVMLLLIGAGIIAVNRHLFGAGAAGTGIYPTPVSTWVGLHHWVFWAVAAVATLVGLAALRWLLVQTRTDKIHRLVVDTESDNAPGSGRTSLTAPTVCATITEQAQALAGVRKATAAIAGHQDAPELWLQVTVDQDADTAAIRAQLVSTVLADARTALELPDMPSYLTVQVSTRRTERQVA